MRRHLLALLLVVGASLVAASGAQAIVVNDAGSNFGVALVPGTTSSGLTSAGISPVTSGGPCTDPSLSADLSLPSYGLCYDGGPVLSANETFAFTWDPARRYWQTTRNFVQTFLGDVAAGSGSLSSPYALTSQYTDGNHVRAANKSLFGGACIDYGPSASFTCRFGDASGSGSGGNTYPTSCPVTGTDQFVAFADGSFGPGANVNCVTDADVRAELQKMIPSMNIGAHVHDAYAPLLTVLLPTGVDVCLDSAGKLCSANSTSSVQFCSYHAQINVGGTTYNYLVQPWTALTGCDEPDVPNITSTMSATDVAKNVGMRLVSPLSRTHISSIVNPALNGWVALDGSEIGDHGCVPFGTGLDQVTVGPDSYWLQREFNNAGVIQTDFNSPRCAPSVALQPAFVVPSVVNPGDIVQFDGSTSITSLIIPGANYQWDFGDGTGATGPSVEHSYAHGGTFSVKLTVTDRGGNTTSLVQQVAVSGGGTTSTPPPPTKQSTGLKLSVLILPRSMGSMLRYGVDLLVRSNEPAAGLVSLSISKQAAKQAHITTGRSATVVVGRGTVSSVKAGTVRLRIHLSKALAAKLRRLRHVTVTVRLALVGTGGDRSAIDVAGKY